MTGLPDRASAPLQGDEADLFERYERRLRRVVGSDVRTNPANIEDAW